MAPFLEALSFLTLIPVPRDRDFDEDRFIRSLAAFPAVGLVIGGVAFGVGTASGLLWGDTIRAAMIIAVTSWITAGFHLDGLSDSCDALFSWRSRERKLEIMKDSRIGAMGAIALVVVLLLKYAALVDLGAAWWTGALLAPVVGRWGDLYGIFAFPAASSTGLGNTFKARARLADFGVATGFASACIVLVAPGSLLVLPLTVVGSLHLAGRAMTRDLGGLTGDTYGALSELGEVVTLLTLAALV